MISSFVRALVSRGPRIEAGATAAQRADTFWSRRGPGLDPRFPLGSLASPCWTVFSLRVRGTRIADIASDPQIWGSPRVDDDRNGPGAPILSSFVFLDTTGVAVVIAEQAAQSLTTSHLPVRTADAFFRFEQRVPEPLMVAFSVIMMDELSDGTAQRWLTEEDHPLQALALDRQNKPFDVSVQIRRTVGQPNDVRSGVLEQIAKLRGELLVAIQDEESLAAQKAVEWVGEIPTDLHHERAIRPRSDSGNMHFSRRQLDDDEHIHLGFDFAIPTTSLLISAMTRGRPGCFRRSL